MIATETISSAPTPEVSSRTYKILHFPDSDVIVNQDADKANLAPKLIELFKEEGTPAGWKVFSHQEQEDDLDVGPKVGMAMGEVDGVSFFLKTKEESGKEIYKANKESKESEEESLHYWQQLNSVLPEVAMSPAVKRIVVCDEAQEIAKEFGFKGISFVEPVIAVIYRKTGKKSLIYEYIPGAKDLDLHMGLISPEVNAYNKKLNQLFIKHGFEPNDAGASQTLLDPSGYLHLIDIELFDKLHS